MATGSIGFAAAVVPQLLAVGAKVYLGTSDSRLVSKIEKDIGLHDVAPERSQKVLGQLIYHETISHAQRRLNTAQRKLKGAWCSGSSLGVLIFGAGAWGFGYWAIKYWWPLWIAAVFDSLLGIMWVIAGTSNLFEYPTDEESTEEGDGPQPEMAKP